MGTIALVSEDEESQVFVDHTMRAHCSALELAAP